MKLHPYLSKLLAPVFFIIASSQIGMAQTNQACPSNIQERMREVTFPILSQENSENPLRPNPYTPQASIVLVGVQDNTGYFFSVAHGVSAIEKETYEYFVLISQEDKIDTNQSRNLLVFKLNNLVFKPATNEIPGEDLFISQAEIPSSILPQTLIPLRIRVEELEIPPNQLYVSGWPYNNDQTQADFSCIPIQFGGISLDNQRSRDGDTRKNIVYDNVIGKLIQYNISLPPLSGLSGASVVYVDNNGNLNLVGINRAQIEAIVIDSFINQLPLESSSYQALVTSNNILDGTNDERIIGNNRDSTSDITVGTNANYIGLGISPGVTNGGQNNDAAILGGHVQSRYHIQNSPVSLRGSLVFTNEAVVIIPNVSYDVGIASDINAYLGVGYSFITSENQSTPMGNQDGVVFTLGAEAEIGENLVIYGDTKLGMKTYENSPASSASLHLGLGYQF